MRVSTVILAMLAGLILIAAIALLMGIPTMLLINYLFSSSFLTTVFGTSKLGFWKAFWLNVLAGILIKSSSSNSKD